MLIFDCRLAIGGSKSLNGGEGGVDNNTPTLTPLELSSMQDYPLNLNILLSGGKETNKDALSNGE